MSSTDTGAHTEILHANAVHARGDRYYWRLAATGFGFLFFGLGAVLIGTVVLPLTRLLPGAAAARESRARALIRRAFRAFAVVMRTAGTISIELRGIERLGQPGQLIIANHPTLIDAILLLAFMHQPTNCVTKAALRRNPLMRGAVRAAGYVSNDPTDAMIARATAALDAGESLLMFPEGTRTRPGKPIAFHRGAANIALRAARQVTPVFITCVPPTLSKAQPWYRIPPRRCHVRLVVGEDIDLQPYRSAPLPLGSRSLNRELQGLFERELSIY